MPDQMKPHPGGLAGRVADALADLELLKATGAPRIKHRWAQTKADVTGPRELVHGKRESFNGCGS